MNPAVGASAAAQALLYAILSTDATLQTMGATVYDQVPETAAFPYVVVGDAVESAWNCFGITGRKLACTIHVYGRSGQDWGQAGYRQVQQVAGRIDQLLDNATIGPGQGWTFVCIDQAQDNYLRESDGITRHVACRYDLLAQA